jgi:hypothetical protein
MKCQKVGKPVSSLLNQGVSQTIYIGEKKKTMQENVNQLNNIEIQVDVTRYVYFEL